mmetsp:Transcript_42121/g.107713  ORF Transcript_42121/g.107713 Transcript_42121/m.107713 type:complete len:250 (+) Transcript_42121:316-1065(+)
MPYEREPRPEGRVPGLRRGPGQRSRIVIRPHRPAPPARADGVAQVAAQQCLRRRRRLPHGRAGPLAGSGSRSAGATAPRRGRHVGGQLRGGGPGAGGAQAGLATRRAVNGRVQRAFRPQLRNGAGMHQESCPVLVASCPGLFCPLTSRWRAWASATLSARPPAVPGGEPLPARSANTCCRSATCAAPAQSCSGSTSRPTDRCSEGGGGPEAPRSGSAGGAVAWCAHPRGTYSASPSCSSTSCTPGVLPP